MRIPVFLVVSAAQYPFVRKWSEDFLEATLGALKKEAMPLPPGVELDPSFPPLPLGPASPDDFDLSNLDPENSETFIVHAFVEAEGADQVPQEIGGMAVFSDPHVDLLDQCPGDDPIGDTADVARNLCAAALQSRGLNGEQVAIAIMDSGIDLSYLRSHLSFAPVLDAKNSWINPTYAVTPGQHQRYHGTMCAYDALICAPRAVLLDFPVFPEGMLGKPQSTVVAQTLQGPMRGISVLLYRWLRTPPGSGIRQYKALVVNNSWGICSASSDFLQGDPRRYIDNRRHPFNRLTATLARSGADIIYSAGDCGDLCPDPRCNRVTHRTIMGANALAQVLTLAACDVHDARLTYSSQGPAIQGMAPNKPDLTAYAHFNGSEGLGDGEPDLGTSAACAVAAGCVAALRTKVPAAATPPNQLFDVFRATARAVNGSGPGNPDYGYGIIDPGAAAARFGV